MTVESLGGTPSNDGGKIEEHAVVEWSVRLLEIHNIHMDVHIDDSFFESEEQEQQACSSPETDAKAKKNYCAKRCEIGVC